MATFNSIGLNAVPRNPDWSVGKKLRTVDSRFSITAAGSTAGDLYILAGPLTFDARVVALRSNTQTTPALTGATDVDLGFWYKDAASGALVEIDKDVIWDGVTLATGITGQHNLLPVNAVGTYDTTKNIGQLLGRTSETEPATGVFLVLQTNTANTATGPLILDLRTEYEEATTR